MQYLVVATKHHEGFAMYRYRRTPAASATPPLHRDVIGEPSLA